jgi:hypothetical protein
VDFIRPFGADRLHAGRFLVRGRRAPVRRHPGRGQDDCNAGCELCEDRADAMLKRSKIRDFPAQMRARAAGFAGQRSCGGQFLPPGERVL